MRRNNIFYFLLLTFLMSVAACQKPVRPDGQDDGQGTGQPETPENPEQPAAEYYSEVTSSIADWSGEYLIAYTDNDRIVVFGSWDESAFGQPAAENGEEIDFATYMGDEGIPAENGDPYRSVIEKVGDHYSIEVQGVGHIGYEGSGNTLSRAETLSEPVPDDYLWDIAYDGGIMLKSVKAPDRRLQWNTSGHPRFSTYTGGQGDLTLYRKASGQLSPDPDPDPNPDPDPDPDPEPEPEPEPDPEPNPNLLGWFELPAVYDEDQNGVDDNDNTLYYASHLCAGGEKYGHNGKTARNYTVCYSAEHHCPVWVAAPRHSMYESGASRTDAYGKDPKIPSDIQYNSKSTGGDCNKGHMLGSAERLSSSATNRQVFYYTNIAPQLSSTFNTGGGAWNNLEDHVDGLVCSDTLYEVVGCYFERYTDAYGKTCDPQTISFGGRDDVTRPSMFYYALLRTKNGNTGKPVTECQASELQCVAFVIRHNMEKGHTPQAKDMISVADLEKLTGFRYFTNVPNAPKNTFSASDWL